jgi:hypothetical protein
MSEMFEGVDTETLRTLHRQIGSKAIEIYEEAAIAGAAGLATYPELMAYGRQLGGTADLISTELGIRHQISISARRDEILASWAEDDAVMREAIANEDGKAHDQ